MKQSIFLFALLAFAVVLTPSCNNDDDNPNPNDGIEGDWIATAFDYTSTSTTTTPDFSTTVLGEGTGSDFTYTLSFDNGTYTSNGGYTVNLVVTDENGNILSDSDFDFDSVESTGNYSVDGNVMTTDNSFISFEADGMPQSQMQGEQMAEFEINSDGDLVFDMSQESVEDFGGGITSSVTIVGTIVFSRI